jgi:hypothetical protein
VILLGKSYLSPLLTHTAAQYGIPVVYAEDLDHELMDVTEPLLSTSEDATAVLEALRPDHPAVRSISLFKDKAKFRKWMASFYPNFTFREYTYEALLKVPVTELTFPCVVKPSVGYASLGVYRVGGPEEWPSVRDHLQRDIEEARQNYPESMIDVEHFLVEEWIAGEEYAVDAYFNRAGEPVVLNVLKRMFSHEGDTSDRIYYTSRQVLREALQPVKEFLKLLGQQGELSLFPLHMEVRIKPNGVLVPIEVNPMRFAGAWTCDLVRHAYGHNLYEHYWLQTKPDWEGILAVSDESVYSFFCAELPSDYPLGSIERVHERAFIHQFSEVLEYRSMYVMDPKTFAVVFYRSRDLEENRRLLALDLTEFVCIETVERG